MKLKQISLALAAIGMCSLAIAQEQAKDSEQIHKVEVTGTSIKRTSTETASPVQVITAADIKRSGATNMTQLLQMIPAISGGGQNDFTAGSGFASGTATASMRGLGSASTLTLINGRRMAATATADPNSGQSTLYNINSIPMSAIERIEVLKDGASAVYGSDAIAGVVNIILKKEYQGFEATATASGATQGGFQNQNISVFGGWGNMSTDGYNLMAGLDASNRPGTQINRTAGIDLNAVQRGSFSGGLITDPDTTSTLTPNYWPETGVGKGTYNTTTPLSPTKCPTNQISTTYLDSGAPACITNLGHNEYFTTPSKSLNLFSRASFDINKDMSGFVELGISRLENEFPDSWGYATLSNSLATWFDPSGNRRSFRFVMPANHPDNPLFIANPNNKLRMLTSALLGDIPVNTLVNQTTYRFVAGLNGSHFGWDWQTGILLNQSRRDETDKGMINAVTAQAALEQYRFNGVNSPALLRQISPDAFTPGKTSVGSVDFKATREFGSLPGGAIGIAVGGEMRHESIQITPDANLAAGNYVSIGGSAANGSRNVGSLFTELNMPVWKTVDIEAAARYDHYSDYGSSTTPKFGFKWTPVPELSVRGTLSEGFRAPGLTQISSSNVSGFQSISTWIDPVRCPLDANGVSRPIPGATGYDTTSECNAASSKAKRTISSFVVANPALQPETSRSQTLGFVFAPTSNLSGTLDFYTIDRKNEIDRFSSNDTLKQLYQQGNTSYANAIFRSPDSSTLLKDKNGAPVPGTAPIVGVVRRFQNMGESIVKGIDLEIAYKKSLGAWGNLTTAIYAGYNDSFKTQRLPGLPFVDKSGTASAPKLKARFSASWTKGDYNVYGAVNYLSGYSLATFNSTTGVRTDCPATYAADPYDTILPGCRVPKWYTVDVGTSYSTIKNLTLTANVTNLLNRAAPYDPNYTYYNTSIGGVNPMGRVVSLSASYKFK